jgi:hypothetical protein
MGEPARLLAARETVNGGPSVAKVRALDSFFRYRTIVLDSWVLVVNDEGDIRGGHLTIIRPATLSVSYEADKKSDITTV